MAEIKIEKKSTTWPWILLGIVIVALLIYFLAFRNNDDDDDMAQVVDTTQAAAPGNDNPVAEYIQFVNADNAMGLDHEYTNGALSRLISAVQYKAGQVGYDITADLDQVKTHADHITQDPFETSHAEAIRGAADILAGSMQRMQQAKYPALQNEVTDVQNAASQIKPAELTLDQKDAVKNFFSKSAQLLQNMN